MQWNPVQWNNGRITLAVPNRLPLVAHVVIGQCKTALAVVGLLRHHPVQAHWHITEQPNKKPVRICSEKLSASSSPGFQPSAAAHSRPIANLARDMVRIVRGVIWLWQAVSTHQKCNPAL
jgi:hypothetical protein